MPEQLPLVATEDEPFIEVVLSRSSYRVGESVVGTIRLVPPTKSQQSPREIFRDSYLFVAGWCRLNPRWHRASESAKLYEHPAVHHNMQNRRESNGSVVIDENCVCFWTTHILHLQDLKERVNGRWEDVKPKPIGGSAALAEGRGKSKEGHNESNGQGTNNKPLEFQQLAFTFRSELPLDLPHTLRANSCRYFYAVIVGTRVQLPSSRKQWLRHATPIQVLSMRPDQPLLPDQSATAGQANLPKVYTIGSCSAMAHSVGLPCHVTATQLSQPPGQILVNRRGSSSLGGMLMARCRSPEAASVVRSNLQTMRITDLQGMPVCVLTVMGVAIASPGSRIVLKLDFPIPRRGRRPDPWTPCYQVSASLEGEEVALYLDGTRKRAQAYQFDTAHELVDPDCTERVCLSLQVPLDAPTTVSTDIVEIKLKCILDITVGSGTSSGDESQQQHPQYSNLRLELAGRIVHPLSEYEVMLAGEDVDQDEDDAYLKLPLDELILGESYRSGVSHPGMPPLIETAAIRSTQDSTHPSSFVTKDIREDLTILSLRMAKECHLVGYE
jgi:hypothetical protein